MYNSGTLLKFFWLKKTRGFRIVNIRNLISVFTIGRNQDLLVDVAEGNPYCVIIS